MLGKYATSFLIGKKWVVSKEKWMCDNAYKIIINCV